MALHNTTSSSGRWRVTDACAAMAQCAYVGVYVLFASLLFSSHWPSQGGVFFVYRNTLLLVLCSNSSDAYSFEASTKRSSTRRQSPWQSIDNLSERKREETGE
jgi:hypothetical protein